MGGAVKFFENGLLNRVFPGHFSLVKRIDGCVHPAHHEEKRRKMKKKGEEKVREGSLLF